MQNKIILATNNQGKVGEFNNLLAGKCFNIIAQSELNISEAKESGLTFVENAILKARHASLKANLPAIADDSGLMVDVLNGAPGIYSARYAGCGKQEKVSKTITTPPSAADNIARVLFELKDIPEKNRGARFCCVTVYLRYAKDPAPLVCQGFWEGSILLLPRGNNGFGYDPIFWVPTHNCSAAELSLEVKNQVSARGQAVRQLVGRMLSLD